MRKKGLEGGKPGDGDGRKAFRREENEQLRNTAEQRWDGVNDHWTQQHRGRLDITIWHSSQGEYLIWPNSRETRVKK